MDCFDKPGSLTLTSSSETLETMWDWLMTYVDSRTRRRELLLNLFVTPGPSMLLEAERVGGKYHGPGDATILTGNVGQANYRLVIFGTGLSTPDGWHDENEPAVAEPSTGALTGLASLAALRARGRVKYLGTLMSAKR